MTNFYRLLCHTRCDHHTQRLSSGISSTFAFHDCNNPPTMHTLRTQPANKSQLFFQTDSISTFLHATATHDGFLESLVQKLQHKNIKVAMQLAPNNSVTCHQLTMRHLIRDSAGFFFPETELPATSAPQNLTSTSGLTSHRRSSPRQ